MSNSETIARLLLTLFALSVFATGARADVTYVWQTLSATVDGQPTNLTASGEITLTNAGFNSGFAEVTSTLGGNPFNPSVVQTLDGVVSAGFEMFGPPAYGALFGTGQTGVLVNFIALPSGSPDLTIIPENRVVSCCTGFMAGIDETAAYFGSPDGLTTQVLTVSYGTDNDMSPCFGPQTLPGSRCVVTGVFARVPEPAALPLLLPALSLLGFLRCRARLPGPRWLRRVR